MLKRTWIVIGAVLVLGAGLSACGDGKLAAHLTPIPTLPKGEEPALLESLQVAPPTEGAAEEAGAALDEAQLAALGEDLFVQCQACHGPVDGAGPALTGMAERAAVRVAGMSAEEYLYESIVNPSAFVVSGYQDIMPKTYGESFSDAELDALVAYILARSGGEATMEAVPTEEPTPAPTPEPTAVPTEPPTPEPEAGPAGIVGDPVAGEALFVNSCSACHGAQDGVGPALTGMGERAATRVAGISAEKYLHQSIVEPSAFVVEGYNDIMPQTFGAQLSEQALADLVAYMLAN